MDNTSTAVAPQFRRSRLQVRRSLRRYGWTIAVYVLLLVLMTVTVAIKPDYGPFEVNTLALGALPLVFAAAAQTVVVVLFESKSRFPIDNNISRAALRGADDRQTASHSLGVDNSKSFNDSRWEEKNVVVAIHLS